MKKVVIPAIASVRTDVFSGIVLIRTGASIEVGEREGVYARSAREGKKFGILSFGL